MLGEYMRAIKYKRNTCRVETHNSFKGKVSPVGFRIKVEWLIQCDFERPIGGVAKS
jgi:hypothetical protein